VVAYTQVLAVDCTRDRAAALIRGLEAGSIPGLEAASIRGRVADCAQELATIRTDGCGLRETSWRGIWSGWAWQTLRGWCAGGRRQRGRLAMTDKRYQIFVSSTLLDLRDERQRVLRVLLELDCIPAGMELFPASDEERWSLIRRVIDDCDYYIVIVGGRYGSVDPEGISYTEREYEYAVTAGKPVLGFVHGNPDQIEYGKSEKDDLAREKLSAFRKKVQQLVCREWTTGEELAAAVTTSLHQEMIRKPGIGWIRGDAAVPPEVRVELAELRERVSKASTASPSAESVPDESLQQGEDRFSVMIQLTDVGVLQTGAFSRTWNDLFRMVGPLVRDKTSDRG